MNRCRQLLIGMLVPAPGAPKPSMEALASAARSWNPEEPGFADDPIEVEALPGERPRYQVVRGTDRLLLARALGWDQVWVSVLEPGEAREGFERPEKIDPMEVARSIERIIEASPLVPAKIAKIAGVSRSQLVHRARLTRLALPVAEVYKTGRLPESAVRLLVTLDERRQVEITKKALSRRWSVAQIAEAARQARAGEDMGESMTHAEGASAAAADVERRISEHLAAPVSLTHRANGSGEIRIRYATLDILDGILNKMGIELGA